MSWLQNIIQHEWKYTNSSLPHTIKPIQGSLLFSLRNIKSSKISPITYTHDGDMDYTGYFKQLAYEKVQLLQQITSTLRTKHSVVIDENNYTVIIDGIHIPTQTLSLASPIHYCKDEFLDILSFVYECISGESIKPNRLLELYNLEWTAFEQSLIQNIFSTHRNEEQKKILNTLAILLWQVTIPLFAEGDDSYMRVTLVRNNSLWNNYSRIWVLEKGKTENLVLSRIE